ncbi:MAG: LysR family transcriptional regulator [Gammaproteobacteria bacterium]|nr:LysR family transcriptional regulator [Gammaproteobacteria bacterium]MDP2141572.1 LysR family transcriptional regulator [Gammaproteobacteria bacterium]MDP2346672.1 LysR family transcriptional regulator [Gammaproteobacteria bacterium]
MDTQNLKAFVAVAVCRSFSIAADRLHITQPAISKRIHMLEQQLDTQLFDRIGRQVSLTEAGRTLLPHAEAILDAMHTARQAITDLTGEVKGQLKLITSHHIGLHRLPRILREYTERFPLVDLDIRFMDSGEAYSAVLKGECDLGIITEVARRDEALSTRTVWKDRMLFVAAPQHPLSRLESVTLADISPYQALLPERRFYTTQLVEELFTRNGLSIKINLATNYLETIKALISAGYAWGVLPRSMLQDGSLKVLSVHSPDSADPVSITRNLDCIYHRQRLMSNAGRAFLDMLWTHADQ